MAKIYETNLETFYTLTKYEAANIIALLAGQLADVNINGNCLGACPEVKIQRNGKRVYFTVGNPPGMPDVTE
jgi:hypothetical protein